MIPPASTGATISPDGKEIWIGGHGDGNQVNEKVLVYSLQSGEMVRSLHAPFMPVNITRIVSTYMHSVMGRIHLESLILEHIKK